MSRKNSLLLAISILTITGATIWVAELPPAKEIQNAAKVNSVLRAPQTYDGEHIERLAALGAEAVPAIGNELTAGYAYPVDLLYALREIENPSAAAPIVHFVLARKPHSDNDVSFITAEAIRVLAKLPSRSSCAPLLEVLRDESAHPRIRLATSAALINACDGAVEAEAEDQIQRFYGDRDRYLQQVNDGFGLTELLSTLLLASDSDAVAEVSVNVLTDFPLHGMVSAVIQSIKPETPGYGEALDAVLSGQSVPLENRLAAAEALVAHYGPSIDGLQEKIVALKRDAEEDGYPMEILERARMLELNSGATDQIR